MLIFIGFWGAVLGLAYLSHRVERANPLYRNRVGDYVVATLAAGLAVLVAFLGLDSFKAWAIFLGLLGYAAYRLYTRSINLAELARREHQGRR